MLDIFITTYNNKGKDKACLVSYIRAHLKFYFYNNFFSLGINFFKTAVARTFEFLNTNHPSDLT